MKLENIDTITVIGLGRMGHGIAQTFAVAGYQVQGFDESADARNSTLTRIRRNLDQLVAHELLPENAIEETLDRITIKNSESQAAEGAQFVVEAIAEDRIEKQDYFARIENCVPDDTILASNSSTFTISESGIKMRQPDRALVTHWFNPPHIVPTVEIVPGPTTTKEVTETTLALHKKIGKLAVRLNFEIPGFLVNRIQTALVREVWDLYDRGVASAEDIDAAVQGSLGFRLATCGQLAVCDSAGLDIWSTVFQGLAPHIRSDAEIPKSIQTLIDNGNLGLTTGAGIHNYQGATPEELSSQRDAKLLRQAKHLRHESLQKD
jgi:3-hydroxybutyryl-CoA dehydrogenase